MREIHPPTPFTLTRNACIAALLGALSAHCGSVAPAEMTEGDAAVSSDQTPATSDAGAPQDAATTSDDAPTATEDTPPAREDVPPAREDVPPAREDVPPAREDVPPAREDVPPAPEDTPPPPEDTPPPPEDTPPPPEDVPSCGAGEGMCGGSCVSLQTRENCGRCGQRCNYACGDGRCTNPTEISAGSVQSCALMSNGEVYCWGSRGVHTARRVDGVTDAVAVYAGSPSCALRRDGTVLCWNSYTVGGTTVAMSPWGEVKQARVGSVAEVAVGGGFACARASSGSVLCWGDNEHGQLGVGSVGGVIDAPRRSTLTGATALFVGHSGACARLGSGAVQCWGRNASRMFGANTPQPAMSPVNVPGLSALSAQGRVLLGTGHLCAVEGSAVRCQGDNRSLQAGVSGATTLASFVNVPGLAGVTDIDGGYDHTCGLSPVPNSTLRGIVCWGSNFYGQSARAAIGGNVTPSGYRISSTIQSMSVGGAHVCLNLGFNGVTCFGWNEEGQLGDGTTSTRATPVRVVW